MADKNMPSFYIKIKKGSTMQTLGNYINKAEESFLSMDSKTI